ncbi:helix-turn-helix domain-containing protein [Chloroflexota bacterium]
MLVKTRIFELYNNGYKNLSELAQAMGISVSQIYRVREGKRQINQKFIVGAMKAFPNHRLDDLFYLVPPSPTVKNHYHQHSVTHFTGKPAAREKRIMKST